ncbi:efflux RND transporter permease subunit [Carboxydocella sp. ULO1]|uniref:efflux RND transporter permease subunit n=1 Tax=Carboxydocella sp. ULO1 TaxID=1926599 RepID=UPI0009AEE777|nr:efflux RND transporter permease subunit [Carboxydocella sp. ULO1]GAW29479.1 acriflavin resistance protein [Carboxydocella sp. ULO1]
MNWAEFSLKHKYTIFSLLLAIIVFGIFSYKSLKTELFPETAPPLVNVVTAYPGVSGKDIAETLSKPLEEEFATIPGVKNIKSTSQDGLSVIKVEFHYGTDVDSAAVDVQNAINRIKRTLPAGIQEPQVMKFSSSSKPVVSYSLTSQQLDLTAIRTLAENELKRELQLVDGVAAVDILGGHNRQQNVLIDKRKLEALNLSLNKVLAALKTQNVTEPGGRITDKDQEYSIRIFNEYRDLDEIGNTIIDNRNGNLIYLKDIARIEDSNQEQRSAYRFNGEKAIGIQILKREEANTVEVVKKIEAKIKQLAKQYPYIKFTKASDDSIFTLQVVDNMAASVRDALIFTSLIVLFFLSVLNESVVVAASMPFSLLLTFALMKIFGMELNLVTLSAIILSVGIVVDDAIIVVENIMRHHHELQKDLRTATIAGTQEILLPAVAGTATIMVVLVPLLFLQGFIGKVFAPVAKTIIFAMGSSLVVALTIIPLLTYLLGARRWNLGEEMLAKILQPFTSIMEKLKRVYVVILHNALRFRLLTLVAAAVLLLLSVRLLGSLGMEVLPKLDAGSFTISLQTVPGTSLLKTVEIVALVEKELKKETEVRSFSTQIGYEPGSHYLGESGAMGVNQAYITVNLTSRKERKDTIWEIEDRLRQKLARIPDIETFVIKEAGGTARATTSAPIDIRVYGSDPKVLNYLANQIKIKLKSVNGVVNIYKSWTLNTPQINVHVNETRAAQLGLSPTSVANEIFSSFAGIPISKLKQENGQDTDIFVRFQEEDRNSINDLLNATLTSPLGITVPLRQVATLEVKEGANLVTRENLQQSIDIFGHTYNRSFSHVLKDVEKALQDMQLPDGYRMEIAGEATDLQESRNELLFVLVIAVISVYLLLVAQFRSFIHPVTIMLAIPLVITGVAGALFLAGKAVSMPVLLGIILLVGTVVRNSIVLVDYTLQARSQGIERNTAVIDSVKIRFRPIMMTAFSNVVGMLPLALELALGAERFSPLAIAVIGGILTATFLTMIVIPVVYTLFDDLATFFARYFVKQQEVKL